MTLHDALSRIKPEALLIADRMEAGAAGLGVTPHRLANGCRLLDAGRQQHAHRTDNILNESGDLRIQSVVHAAPLTSCRRPPECDFRRRASGDDPLPDAPAAQPVAGQSSSW